MSHTMKLNMLESLNKFNRLTSLIPGRFNNILDSLIRRSIYPIYNASHQSRPTTVIS
jgi:hypothetical protein